MDTSSVTLLPDPVIYGVLLLGAIMVLFRPYWAFLFGIFLPIAIDSRTMIFSRLSGVGEYFNMMDACLAICAAATMSDLVARRSRLTVPALPLAMLCVLVMGFANSTLSYGSSYETLRALRWGLTSPILYIIGTNLIVTEARVQRLFVVVFAASVVAESQHMLLVMSHLDASVGNEKNLRTTAFMLAHSASWLVAGPFMVAGRLRRPLLQFAAATLFLAASVTHQTRSVAISAGCAAVIYYGWLVPGRVADKMRRFRPLLVALVLGLLVAMPRLGLGGFVDSYSDRMEQLSAQDEGTHGRQQAIEVELDNWMDGNLLIGRGLAYFFASEFRTPMWDEVAWGHIGYVTYLSQLGVIGFLVYGLWLPFNVLSMASGLLRRSNLGPETRHLVGLAGAVFLFCAIGYAMSGNFLFPDVLPGVLAGLVTAGKAGSIARAEIETQDSGAAAFAKPCAIEQR